MSPETSFMFLSCWKVPYWVLKFLPESIAHDPVPLECGGFGKILTGTGMVILIRGLV